MTAFEGPIDARVQGTLARQVASELRWAFKAPREWLIGVGVNLVLSILYLWVVPMAGYHRRNWIVLLGTYFGTFILADVTSTNILGVDLIDVRRRLAHGATIQRILVVKNICLLVIVAMPTLMLTAVLTLRSEPAVWILATVPAVALPMLIWVSVGNIVSVLLPVESVSIRTRWRRRRELRLTARWLIHLAIPYALFYPLSFLSKLPRMILKALPTGNWSIEMRGLVLVAIAALIWVFGVQAATSIARRRPRGIAPIDTSTVTV